MVDSSRTPWGFDPFELLTAIILGVAAIGGAWAGYQNSLWSGNQATSFSVASNLLTRAARKTTQAEAFYSEAIQTANADRAVFRKVRELYIESALSEDEPKLEADRIRAQVSMKFILTHELTKEAYTHLRLPEGMFKNEDTWSDLTTDEAEYAAERRLGDDYFETLLGSYAVELAKAQELQRRADARFVLGRRENFNGDLFTFTGVLFTVCLFLAGIGLVFKTRIRWVFAGGAAVMLVLAMVDLTSHPWTEPTEIPDAEVEAASIAAASAAAEASAIVEDDPAPSAPTAGSPAASAPAASPPGAVSAAPR